MPQDNDDVGMPDILPFTEAPHANLLPRQRRLIELLPQIATYRDRRFPWDLISRSLEELGIPAIPKQQLKNALSAHRRTEPAIGLITLGQAFGRSRVRNHAL